MSYRERHRLLDILTAIDAIESHVARTSLTDGMAFDAVRMRVFEIGEAVKALPAELLDLRPEIAWASIARMRDHLAHRYFDTASAVVSGVVHDDLVPLRAAVTALLDLTPDDDEPGHQEGRPGRSD